LHTKSKLLPGLLSFHKNEIILAFGWLLVQLILFYQHGIQTDFEARKYIEQADLLITTGSVSSTNFWFYSVQIFLITAAKKLQTGFISVVIIQWLFNFCATWALYKFATRIADKRTGFIITLLFIFNFPLQTFNSFLQTESLFYSFTILATCYLLSLRDLNAKKFILIVLLLTVISFTRPTGLLWIPCTFLYLFFRFFKTFPFLLKIGITIVAAIGFLFFLNFALGSGGELDFILPFRDEMIICGVPTLSNSADIKTLPDQNSVAGLADYITHHFATFSRLAWLRTRAFWGLTRSYYSNGHNLYLALYFYPIYILSLLAIPKWMRKDKSLLLYCFSLLFLTWGAVTLTCDDWHNRFLLSVIPYVYILSIPVIHNITTKLAESRVKRKTANPGI
jgi:hypothetical protein